MKDEVQKFVQKVNDLKKDEFDLSKDEDLSIAIMNLVSIEEHFFFTAEKTEKKEYLDLLNEVREIRKTLLKKLVPEYEGEVWCISKHLLAASMRLMEVGTKSLSSGNKKEAEEFFDKAYNLYSLFWGVNLKLVEIDKIDKVVEEKIDNGSKKDNSIFGKLKAIVKRAVDCCIE
jgi:hypothetical protein